MLSISLFVVMHTELLKVVILIYNYHLGVLYWISYYTSVMKVAFVYFTAVILVTKDESD